MQYSEVELQRFREAIIVLYQIVNSRYKNSEDIVNELQDAIHDVIFGHSIRNDYYLTEDEFTEAENEILEMLNINREDF